jgi:hypothetical protein
MKLSIWNIQFVGYEEFEDTKVVIRISKLKKDRQHNGKKKKKDKQQSTKHYI